MRIQNRGFKICCLVGKVRCCIESSVKHYSRTRVLYDELSPHDMLRTGRISRPVISVTGSGGAGGGRGIAVEFEGSRYLFNCGESTDRLLKDVRWNTVNLKSIFLTHLSWGNMGGLASLALFLQERGTKHMLVRGPKGANKYLEAASSFVKLYRTKIKVLPCDESRPIVDGPCRIDCLPIRDTKPAVTVRSPLDKVWTARRDRIDFFHHERRKGSQQFLNCELDESIDQNTSYVYICTFASEKKLSLSKCVEKGVPPGPLLYKLFEGEDVILDDGTVVKASDVMQSEQQSYCALVVDCPKEGFVEDLVKMKCFKPPMKTCGDSDNFPSPSVIVHFTPSSVMKSSSYKRWMKCFPRKTVHLVVNDTNSPSIIKGALKKQEYLRTVFPDIFPCLEGVPMRLDSQPFSTNSKDHQDDICIEDSSFQWRKQWGSSLRSLRMVEGRPWTSIDLKDMTVSRIDEMQSISTTLEKELSVVDEFQNALKDLKERSKLVKCEPSKDQFNAEEWPVITFLGTGSKCSSTYRNSSGILLQVSKDKAILLDCGEGTLGQLAMLYSSSQLQKILASLRAIYISHLHADHHMGLISIILAQKNAVSSSTDTNPLLLLAPEEITSWLSLYHDAYEPILDNITLIPLRKIELGRGGPLSIKYDLLLREALDMTLVCTCRVLHCVGAFGVSFLHRSGWKITYSGDTLFCPALVNIGMNSDLLIHEATFSSYYHSMARKKRHSTTRDAVKVGNDMKAKHIILTHFSQRYEYLPDIVELEHMEASNVGIAFDFMQVRLIDLPTLPLLNNVYKAVFPDELVEIEKQKQKYNQRITGGQ